MINNKMCIQFYDSSKFHPVRKTLVTFSTSAIEEMSHISRRKEMIKIRTELKQ